MFSFNSYFRTSVGNRSSCISKVFLLVSPASCLCFICTNIKGMCWPFYFYFKNRNWKNSLRIFDTTKLKNSQRNCPSLGWEGLTQQHSATLGAQCSPERPISEGCWMGGVNMSLVPGFNKGAYNGYFVFCFTEEQS